MDVWHQTPPLTLRQVFKTWWPLALSWVLMSVEGPAHAAVSARLANPEINLAAWGGIVFPLALMIESPIVMLLAASTAWSKDWGAYRQLRRFMMYAGAILTAVHVVVAFTPLYYSVVRDLMGSPEEIIEPARLGLMIMTPWTWSIAYRRFYQGVLIRFGHSQAVGTGTVIRLAANGLLLALGYAWGALPGIVVASSAVATGVIAEAIYAGLRVRPVLRRQLRPLPGGGAPPAFRSFLGFYVPLALTSVLTLIVPSLVSAALGRMPRALDSLAIWPVVNGLVFILRSPGIAYTETVVALLDYPGSLRLLRRFTWYLIGSVSGIALLVTATPFSRFWFTTLSGLSPELSVLARNSLWMVLLLPNLAVMVSWFQGLMVNGRCTRGISEAVALSLGFHGACLALGVLLGTLPGVYVGLIAYECAGLAQALWMWYRSRDLFRDNGTTGCIAAREPIS
ncbi:MAG: hypothetical protein JXB35_01400 [Anaerolineae bacterium]|nr:hypothetical protein [Anaerolineae bacterium]